jgi:glycosyltransferase involved in cell wall biosynthesis
VVTISLCMIVKNEEETIGRCLESVHNRVDEIVVVDTGSTDQTKEIVRLYTDKIYDFEWIDDFAAARNYAFSKGTKDYLFWMDADDCLLEEDREKLKELKEEIDPTVDMVTMIYVLSQDEKGNPIQSIRRERLVKRSQNYQWLDFVHEYIPPEGYIMDSNITIIHNKKKSSGKRNLNMLEKRLEAGMNFTPRYLFYYANELFEHKVFEKAAEYFHKYLDTNQMAFEDNVAACDKLAQYYKEMGEPDKELHYLLQTMKYNSPRAEYCCRIGHHFLEKKQIDLAIRWFQMATKMEIPKHIWGLVNHLTYTWLPHLQLAIAYGMIGDVEKAYYHNEIVGTYIPDDPSILDNKKQLEELIKKAQQL